MFVLGFDPGGKNQFGWCVAEATASDGLSLIRSGIGDHASDAVDSALGYVNNLEDIGGVGIDSPMFWFIKGKRRADILIRAEMTRLGAQNVGGTVQEVNSLRGACIVQGIMTGHLLRERVPKVRITESHPKALLWLIEVATKKLGVADVRMSHLKKFIACETDSLTEHERDAALGAVGAYAMISEVAGWRNLFYEEDEPFVPVSPVEYWMPIEGVRG